MSSDPVRTIGSLVSSLLRRFPAEWAEEWDNVGLVIGDATRKVTCVLVTLDATAEAVQRAVSSGANVLITHHPPFLEPQAAPARCPGPAGTLEAAVRAEVAVISLHTNLDRSPEGATALPAALGFTVLDALESSSQPVALIVTYVPHESLEAVRAAMAEAGAGRIGRYEQCAFTSEGIGHFVPVEGAAPAIPDAGEDVAETRLEMVAPRSEAERVVEAARSAHPYEEPVVLALPGTLSRGVARMGRLCSWRDGATVGELAKHVSATLGSACRVWGDSSRPAGRIAIGNGSVGSLVPDALKVADTLIGGEVRYHDALASASSGCAVIEAGHDMTEWPMVQVLRDAVLEWDPGVRVVAESPVAGWWTTEAADV